MHPSRDTDYCSDSFLFCNHDRRVSFVSQNYTAASPITGTLHPSDPIGSPVDIGRTEKLGQSCLKSCIVA